MNKKIASLFLASLLPGANTLAMTTMTATGVSATAMAVATVKSL